MPLDTIDESASESGESSEKETQNEVPSIENVRFKLNKDKINEEEVEKTGFI